MPDCSPLTWTLADAIRAGHATPDDAVRWVAAWHSAPSNSLASCRPLWAHLGLTPEQYAAWVRDTANWPTSEDDPGPIASKED